MKKLLLCLVFGTSIAAFAQPFTVAFSGKDPNSPDEFAFVLLREITNGTIIYITSNDYNNTTGNFSDDGEAIVQFTAGETIARGTVVQISETMADTMTVTGAMGAAVLIGGNSYNITSGDPHYAFSASNAGSPLTSVTEVFAMMESSPTAVGGTTDPRAGTNSHPSAIVVDFQTGGNVIFADYSADRSMATPTTLANPSNFTTGSSAMLDLSPFSGSGLPVSLVNYSID